MFRAHQFQGFAQLAFGQAQAACGIAVGVQQAQQRQYGHIKGAARQAAHAHGALQQRAQLRRRVG